MELYQAHTKEEARAILVDSDETRKQYFLSMTGHDWACAENYDLSIDTSLYPLDDIAELIIELANRKKTAA
jgi:cytidylate kinase